MGSAVSSRKKSLGFSVQNLTQVLAASLAFFLACLPLFSQGSQGTIQGGVFDQTGGAIAGATVTIIDASRGISRPLTTDSAGAYVAANLTPGMYTVRGEAKGFQTVEHPNVLVEVGQNIRVDLTLQPGAQTQTITVTSEVPAVNTTDATLGGTVNNQQINDLPLNGRNYQRLLLLRPGVVGAIGSGTGLESSNGLRTGENLTMVQGLASIGSQQGGSVFNLAYHQGDSGSLLPVDAIQEFNVEQNVKAEYGWKPGAAVNLGVKSGTNAIHGTAYAFGRTDALDASNYFTGKIPISLEQPGGSIGGRIIKDKLFYFGTFEALTYSVGDASAPSVPSFDQTPDPAGDPGSKLTVLDACNTLTSSMANPAAVNPLSALIAGLPMSGGQITSCVPQAPSPTHEEMFPFITTAPAGGNTVTFAPGLTTTNPYYNGLAKIDYSINDHNHLNGLFFYSSAHSTVQNNPSQLFSYWEGNQHTGAHDYALTEVWTPNSNWVNEIRGGYAYLNYISIPEDASVNAANPWGLSASGVPTGYGIPTGVAPVAPVTNSINGGSPQIKITGFSGYLGEGKTVGHRGPEGTVDIRDDVSFLHGQHAFKFGAEFMQQIQGDQQYNTGNGNINFSSLQNFLAGTVKNGAIAISNEDDRLRLNQFAGFVQDDWRVRRTVTLNLGLRYEVDMPPYEVGGNYLGNFYPNVNPATTSALGQAGGPFPSLYHTDYKDFAPRFGVAWDVRGNGRTVVRAGAGIVYSFDTLGSLIDLVPFGANVPSIGLNTSGTLINIFTQDVPTLPGSSFTSTWNTTGPVFPLTLPPINGVTYTGATCTYNGETGVQLAFVTQCPTNASTNPNFHQPRIAEWNFDVQRAITNNLTIEVSYVGNHGWEASRLDINQAPIGWGWNGQTPALDGLGGLSVNAYCLNQGSMAAVVGCLKSPPTIASAVPSLNKLSTVSYNEETGAPYFSSFPYLSNIDETNNFDYSNYNGLQITLTERPTHGLTFLAGYTFAHALDIASSDSATNDATDAYNPRLNYGNGNNDVRQRFTLSSTYNFPGIKSPAQMLQGWSASFIVGVFSGAPWGASDATNDFDGTNEINNSAGANFQPWNFSGNPATFSTVTHNEIPCYGSMNGCQPFPGGTPPAVCQTAAVAPYSGNPQLQALALAALQNTGCYVENGDVLTPPAYGTLGDAPKNFFRGPAYYNLDLSVAKLWKFKERYTATFRIEFFNLFNRADFTVPGAADPGAGGNFGCTCTTPDGAGSTNAVLGSGAAREAQLGLKLTF